MSNPVILYRDGGILRRVFLDQLILLEATDNYVKFHFFENYSLIRTSLEAVMRTLPKNMFVRVHRSYAIRTELINTVEKDKLTLTVNPSIPIPISKGYYRELMEVVTLIRGNSQNKGVSE